jgi:hypothetical protein
MEPSTPPPLSPLDYWLALGVSADGIRRTASDATIRSAERMHRANISVHTHREALDIIHAMRPDSFCGSERGACIDAFGLDPVSGRLWSVRVEVRDPR